MITSMPVVRLDITRRCACGPSSLRCLFPGAHIVNRECRRQITIQGHAPPINLSFGIQNHGCRRVPTRILQVAVETPIDVEIDRGGAPMQAVNVEAIRHTRPHHHTPRLVLRLFDAKLFKDVY